MTVNAVRVPPPEGVTVAWAAAAGAASTPARAATRRPTTRERRRTVPAHSSARSEPRPAAVVAAQSASAKGTTIVGSVASALRTRRLGLDQAAYGASESVQPAPRRAVAGAVVIT